MKLSHAMCSAVLFGSAAVYGVLPAGAAQLILNGGFEADGVETDAPAFWSVASDGIVGNVIATTGSSSPISAYPTAGPASGDFYGLIDAAQPSHAALYQTFTTGAVIEATLAFKLFANDQGDGRTHIDTTGLDWTTGGTVEPNQHTRVDLLAGTPTPFATGSEVLRSFYLNGPNGRGFGDAPNDWTAFSFDVTDLLAAGGTFTLRFANVANQAALQTGVDDVSLTTTIPEPSTWALVVLGLVGVGFALHGRRA
jgi:hypothetical protein